MQRRKTFTSDVFQRAFKNFGINERQFEDYVTLLRCGENGSTCSAMAARSGNERNAMRYRLNSLVNAKIVKKTSINGTHFYHAVEPQELLNTIDHQLEQNKEWKKSFHRELPNLEKFADPQLVIPGAEYFHGIEGVKRVYEDTIINTQIDKIYAYENIEYMTEEIKEWILYDYIPRRAKKKIFIEVISPDNRMHRKAKEDDEVFYRETRFMKEPKFKIQCEMNIYGSRIAFFSYKENEMFGAILDSPAISETMKSTHQVLWNFLKT